MDGFTSDHTAWCLKLHRLTKALKDANLGKRFALEKCYAFIEQLLPVMGEVVFHYLGLAFVPMLIHNFCSKQLPLGYLVHVGIYWLMY